MTQPTPLETQTFTLPLLITILTAIIAIHKTERREEA